MSQENVELSWDPSTRPEALKAVGPAATRVWWQGSYEPPKNIGRVASWRAVNGGIKRTPSRVGSPLRARPRSRPRCRVWVCLPPGRSALSRRG
jgi:hypothetical protein